MGVTRAFLPAVVNIAGWQIDTATQNVYNYFSGRCNYITLRVSMHSLPSSSYSRKFCQTEFSSQSKYILDAAAGRTQNQLITSVQMAVKARASMVISPQCTLHTQAVSQTDPIAA